MVLKISWSDFKSGANNFIEQAQLISQKETNLKAEARLDEIKTEIKEWREGINAFLQSSFEPEQNYINRDVYYASKSRFNIGKTEKPFEQIKKEMFEDFNLKWLTLTHYLKFLEVCDIIVRPESTLTNERSNYTTEEILNLILNKLYDLYDDNTYPIKHLITGNGIPLKRSHEERELARVLEDNGYIELGHGGEISAQITTTGRLYVEQQRKVYIETYDGISSNEAEINSRIDKITEMLTNLGYGQEIIFNEIDELKELYKMVNKKNWGQIVKGKVVDLALGKLAENDTLKYIYETLTDHKLHLP